MTSNIVFSEKKQKDMEWAKGIVSRIEADRRKFVKYKGQPADHGHQAHDRNECGAIRRQHGFLSEV